MGFTLPNGGQRRVLKESTQIAQRRRESTDYTDRKFISAARKKPYERAQRIKPLSV